MKTPKTVSVAVLLLVGIVAAPSVNAQEASDRSEFKVAFTFNPDSSANEIYSSLQRVARDVCEFHGSKSLKLRKYEKDCAKEIVNNGVARLGRADVAALHNGSFAAADTRG